MLTQQGAEADAARQAQLTATKALLFKASESDAALVAQEVRLEALSARCDLAEAAQGVLTAELEAARQGAEAARQEVKALTEKMVRGILSAGGPGSGSRGWTREGFIGGMHWEGTPCVIPHSRPLFRWGAWF